MYHSLSNGSLITKSKLDYPVSTSFLLIFLTFFTLKYLYILGYFLMFTQKLGEGKDIRLLTL